MRSIFHITDGAISKSRLCTSVCNHIQEKQNVESNKDLSDRKSYKKTIYVIIDQILDVLMGV